MPFGVGVSLAVDATRRIGEVGADAINRSGQVGSESIRQGTQDLAETQQQIVRNAAKQFEQLSREVAQAVQGTSEDVHSLMTLPDTARGGLQDLQRGMTGLIEGVVRTNLRATQEFAPACEPGRLCGAAVPVRAPVSRHANREQRHSGPRRSPHG